MSRQWLPQFILKEEKMSKECYVCKTGEHEVYAFPATLCEKHNVCITCGIKRKDLDHTPWGVRKGAFQCFPCAKTEKQKRIAKRIKEGFDCEYTDEVVCPYCGHEEMDGWECSEGKNTCADCDAEFELEIQTTIDYTTSKIEVSDDQ
jgi:hypothetical protein